MRGQEKSNIFVLCFALTFIALGFLSIFIDFATKFMLAISICSCFISLAELLSFFTRVRNALYFLGVGGFFFIVANFLGNDFLGIGELSQKITNIFTLFAFAFLFFAFRNSDTGISFDRHRRI